ncbi:SGNH/GDSL hydrolase family protein [Comamonas sp. NLF-1-9]|uniref:SGNH/GDSL hydrolase family protein n=1 Tax=Comamonas sp. NLF-1-9 TaxID=2853163 RepID=UPI001C48D32B|nr:SGNH/GDSL hydrolase family protein [Comamonas sp. NLF-1-9]QXL84062.1 SGNH/GDSL hydrolase family protein [Comamonas sp. NLF-1-9]
MPAFWLRRTVLVLACASTAWLAACGSSVEKAFQPQRLIAFGDSMAYLGNAAGQGRYTVNDGSVNNWTLQVAQRYNRPLAPSAAGGLSFAQGNARVSAKPDAAGNPATATVVEQVDQFFATQSVQPGDMVMLSAGTADLIVGMRAVLAGSQSQAQYLAQAGQAGADLAAQVQRLYDAGMHVVVAGVYRLGRTPWASALGQEALLTSASDEFNKQLLLKIEPLGERVRYIEMAGYVNPINDTYHRPWNYIGFANSKDPVCASVDPGAGIGTGPNQVNSALCTSATLVPGADVNAYEFADQVYVSPASQRQLGEHAYNDVLRETW